MNPPFTQKDGVPVTPLEYEEFDSQLELICRSCRKKGKYSVGRLFINPPVVQQAFRNEVPYEEAVFFSGYFRCKKCDAPGPWDLSKNTKTRLMLLEVMALTGKAPVPIQFGELRLFDGTVCHSAAEGEAQLLRLIDAAPTDYFLWSRLGNLMIVAEEPARALPAFQKAVELNPQDVESHHSLAEIYWERKEWQQAAHHYHQVLLHARHAPPRSREKGELLKNVVRGTLESLMELHLQTKGQIEVFPTHPPHSIASVAGEQPVLVLKNYDLSREQDWEELTQAFLGNVPSVPRLPAPTLRRESSLPSLPYAAQPVRVGRNDPCPCGSGKKFKKCCSR